MKNGEYNIDKINEQSPYTDLTEGLQLFAGGTSLPDGFSFCGQKQYKADCILWQFRRPNRLATVQWQKSRKRVETEIAAIEKLAFEEACKIESELSDKQKSSQSSGKEAAASELNKVTAKVYQAAIKAWNQMETDFWMAYGRGF